MPKCVLNVGQCLLDHQTLARFLQTHFDVEVLAADGLEATLHALQNGDVDLVLVNRILDRDSSPGLDVIHGLRTRSATAQVPVMLVSNYAESQEKAVAAGAQWGFGKQQLGDPEALARLEQVLGHPGRSHPTGPAT